MRRIRVDHFRSAQIHAIGVIRVPIQLCYLIAQDRLESQLLDQIIERNIAYVGEFDQMLQSFNVDKRSRWGMSRHSRYHSPFGLRLILS